MLLKVQHAGVEGLERCPYPVRPTGEQGLKGRESPDVRVVLAQPRAPGLRIDEGLAQAALQGDEIGQPLPRLVLWVSLPGAPPLERPCRSSKNGGELASGEAKPPSSISTARPGVVSSLDLAVLIPNTLFCQSNFGTHFSVRVA